VLDADEPTRIAAVTEIEISARGKAIFPQGAGPGVPGGGFGAGGAGGRAVARRPVGLT